MMLVPYPHAMSHQEENARVFSKKGAALTIEEGHLSAQTFKERLIDLLNDRKKLDALSQAAKSLSKPESADILAEEVLSLVKG